MGLDRFDAEQVQSVSDLLESYDIEPTIETLQALARTAQASYPNDPDGLEKAAVTMLKFFSSQNSHPDQQEGSWNRLKRWAISNLRIKSVGILPSRDG